MKITKNPQNSGHPNFLDLNFICFFIFLFLNILIFLMFYLFVFIIFIIK